MNSTLPLPLYAMQNGYPRSNAFSAPALSRFDSFPENGERDRIEYYAQAQGFEGLESPSGGSEERQNGQNNGSYAYTPPSTSDHLYHQNFSLLNFPTTYHHGEFPTRPSSSHTDPYMDLPPPGPSNAFNNPLFQNTLRRNHSGSASVVDRIDEAHEFVDGNGDGGAGDEGYLERDEDGLIKVEGERAGEGEEEEDGDEGGEMENEEEPLYVNAKQYNRILKRRLARARLEELNKLHRSRKPYLHESRHRHACSRPRGKGGRFLTADEIEALKKQGVESEVSVGVAA